MENIETKQTKHSESLTSIINKFSKSLKKACENKEEVTKDFKGALIFGYIENLEDVTSDEVLCMCGKDIGVFTLTNAILKKLSKKTDLLSGLQIGREYAGMRSTASLFKKLLSNHENGESI